MITLYLIRHGETEWNKSGRYQGSTDVALSDMGMAQAEKVASYFKDIPLDGVITSPLQRARIMCAVRRIRTTPLPRIPQQ